MYVEMSCQQLPRRSYAPMHRLDERQEMILNQFHQT